MPSFACSLRMERTPKFSTATSRKRGPTGSQAGALSSSKRFKTNLNAAVASSKWEFLKAFWSGNDNQSPQKTVTPLSPFEPSSSSPSASSLPLTTAETSLRSMNSSSTLYQPTLTSSNTKPHTINAGVIDYHDWVSEGFPGPSHLQYKFVDLDALDPRFDGLERFPGLLDGGSQFERVDERRRMQFSPLKSTRQSCLVSNQPQPLMDYQDLHSKRKLLPEIWMQATGVHEVPIFIPRSSSTLSGGPGERVEHHRIPSREVVSHLFRRPSVTNAQYNNSHHFDRRSYASSSAAADSLSRSFANGLQQGHLSPRSASLWIPSYHSSTSDRREPQAVPDPERQSAEVSCKKRTKTTGGKPKRLLEKKGSKWIRRPWGSWVRGRL